MRCFILVLLAVFGLEACGKGPPAWLMSVFTLPAGSEAADDLEDYAVALEPAAAAGALREAPARRPYSAPPPDASNFEPMSRARSVYEAQRRRDVDAIIARIRAGGDPGRFLRGRRLTACAAACDTTTMCWRGTCSASVPLTFPDGATAINANVVGVVSTTAPVTQINVLLDASIDNATTRAAALDAVSKFASTFPRELTLLGQTGHNGPQDRDGDGRMTMVFTNSNGNNPGLYSALVGFFSPFDFLATGTPSADGNEADLLWVRVPGTDNVTNTLAAGTMAHEYVHLVSYGQRVQGRPNNPSREVLWLDEGMAHTMEDLTGWGVVTVRNIEAALNNWGVGPFASGTDSNEQRGRACLLLRWLIDAQARQQGASKATSAQVTTAAASILSSLINDTTVGFQHPVFASGGAPAIWQWLQGLYATDFAAVTHTAAHAYDYLPTGTDPSTNNLIGINPRGTFTDATGMSVVLGGPSVGELDEHSVDPTDSVPQSTLVLWRASGFTASAAKLTSPAVSPGVGPFLQVVQTEGAE